MKFRHLNFRTPSRDGILSSGDQPRLHHAYHSDGYGVCLLIGPYNNASMWTLDAKLPQQKNIQYGHVRSIFPFLFPFIGPKTQQKIAPKLTQ